MKKVLKNLTGIAFILAILVAGSCSPMGIVKINCQAVDDGGDLNFTMWDADSTVDATLTSTIPPKYVADLTTIVEAGGVVMWQWDKNSEVKRFVNVAPPAPGKIIPGPANPIKDHKKFRLVIPGNADPGTESYFIQFMWDGDTVVIDPHLRIPPNALGGRE